MTQPYPKDIDKKMSECLEKTRDIGYGHTTYDLIYSSACFPFQRKRELSVMMELAQRIKPKIVMEIGLGNGGGLFHWCKSQPTLEKVIGSEVREIPYKREFENHFTQYNFLWVGASRNSFSKVKNWLGGQTIDCLFIDGDKKNLDKDFNLYLPLVSPKGIVFCHDVFGTTINPFRKITENSNRQYVKFADTSESLEAIQREMLKIPSQSAYENWLRKWRGRSGGFGVIYKGITK